jgi:cytochrome c-type biogenesis protein CcmF
VFLGTLYPLALETLTGDKISVGAPYFNFTFGILILPLLLLVPIGPFLSWKRADLLAALTRLWMAAAIALLVALLAFAWSRPGPWLAPLGVGLGLWLVAGSLVELAQRVGLGERSLALAWSRFRGLPRASFGMTFAHAGLGVAVIGIVAMTAWRVEAIVALKPGEQVSVAGYDVTYLGDSPLTGANYTGDAGQFRITRNGDDVALVVSEKRQFQPSGMQTTEVGLHQMLSGDLYVVMGDRAGAEGRSIRVYFNPLVSLIWIGALIMFLAGAVSLTDRRYRVGAPKPTRRPAMAPAE